MQVDSNSTFYIKAQNKTGKHVDMWTDMSTTVSKTHQRPQ